MVITLAVIFVGVEWIAPVALSFYAAKKAPAVARVVPTDLKDHSVSNAPGRKLAYVGYEFEIPWNDLDEAQTKLYPKDKPDKFRADLHFHSGLRLLVSSIPPESWARDLPQTFGVSPQRIESIFGHEILGSDYKFIKTIYEFTPDKMNHWKFWRSGFNRDEVLLLVKSIAPSKAAESGIFNLQTQNYRGFQQGNSLVRQDKIIVELYSDEGAVDLIFFQKDYLQSAGVTQPEINRIIQSLHKISRVVPSNTNSASLGRL